MSNQRIASDRLYHKGVNRPLTGEVARQGFLINAAMGILSKAAPQMNMLSEGFPILMLTSFYILTSLLPSLVNLFTSSFSEGLNEIQNLFLKLGGQIK